MKKSKILALFIPIMSLSQTGCQFFEAKDQAPVITIVSPTHPGQIKPEDKKTETDQNELYTTYEIEQEQAQTLASLPEKAGLAEVSQNQVPQVLNDSSSRKNSVGEQKEGRRVKHQKFESDKKFYAVEKAGAAQSAEKLAAFSGAASGSGVYLHQPVPLNTESYDSIAENKIFFAKADPLSTFSIDVDTASYSNMRRFLEQNQKPPVDAIRIEEMINYFSYDYSKPSSEPFSVNLESAQAPWDSSKKLVRIGIKGKEIQVDKRPASNLVFLIDVSGSMDEAAKLPLVKSAMTMMVDKLDKNDKVSIVVYAGAAGLVLEPTTGNNKTDIIKALDRLKAGGSTNGAGGIELAYKTASQNFIKGGVNRVVLATDGDFNVGTTSREGLLDLIKKHADQNIYLSVLGFGMGNYKDGMMETLSNKGNGNYAYVDNLNEARKVMVEQMSGTLITIAKDVKIQVEFNPKLVSSYRLIGYENRILNHEDFNDDKKDAGDIGAGHTVTALYEITPVGASSSASLQPGVDKLKYQAQTETNVEDKAQHDQTSASGELLTVKLRYKKPDGDVSKKIEVVLQNSNNKFNSASNSFQFASAVAMFGMHLRESTHVKNVKLSQIKETAKSSKGEDTNGYKKEFIELINKYEEIQKGQTSSTIGKYEE